MPLRVGVVGCGVSGSIFSALLRRTGIVHVDVFERANRPGGRYTTTTVQIPRPDGASVEARSVDLGGQFLRSSAKDPNAILNRFITQMPGVQEHLVKVFSDHSSTGGQGLDAAVRMAADEVNERQLNSGLGLGLGLRDRIGVVGSEGGFIPLELMKKHREMMKDIAGEGDSMNFCDFVQGSGDYYFSPEGTGIGELFKFKQVSEEKHGMFAWNTEVKEVSRDDQGQWTVVDRNKKEYGPYDVLVHATHNTKFAADTLHDSFHAAKSQFTDLGQFSAKIDELVASLRGIRKLPLYAASVALAGNTSDLPFDACTFHNSDTIQWARLNRSNTKDDDNLQVWSVISTVSYAQQRLPENNLERIGSDLQQALSHQLRPFQDGNAVLNVRAKRWSEALVENPLGLEEPCLSFEPLGLVLIGEYMSKVANAESAALSALDAANRVLEMAVTRLQTPQEK